ncbi:MAG: DNA polymerase III subunit beta, partial [Candidatus Omnitrophica bacterium]|nr:DNA polymerase III subunit beta [Candidatus Omnitrophota bacterium]
MEINIRRKDLLNGLQRIVGVISLKPSLPALSFIFLQAEKNKIFLTATDLELTMRTAILCKTKREGSLLVPGRRFAGIIRELPEAEINIIKEKTEKTQITVGKIAFTLPGLKIEEFPGLPKVKKGTVLRMKQEVLKEMLKKTKFSIAYDETRAYLRGLLFSLKKDSLILVGTDTRRLAYIKKSYSSPAEMDLILPLKLIDELEKSLDGEDVEINISPNQIIFKTANLLIISQLIEGQFPDYEATFPSKEELKEVKVGRERLAAAVRRMNLLTTERHSSIRFDLLPL